MSNDRNDAVARITRTLLAHRGLHQKDLAAAIGMDAGALSRALSGRRQWTVTDICDIAEFFGVSPALFFTEPEDLVRNRWSAHDLVAA